MNFYLDFEAARFSNRIISIGCIAGNGETFETLVSPGDKEKVDKFITELTGITNEMVCNCPTFSEIAPSFLNFINETKLIAHNANFDIGFITSEIEKTQYKNLSKGQCNALDTVKIARKVFPGLPYYKLQYLASHFGIRVDAAHRAYDDARVCMELFNLCMKEAAEKLGTSVLL